MTAAGTQMARDLADQIAELREQRDELLEALLENVDYLSAHVQEPRRNEPSNYGQTLVRNARLAIARARRNP